MSVSYFAIESTLLDLVTAGIMAPVTAVYAVLCGLWAICTAIWPYRKYIGLAITIGAAVVVCVACPLLPVGLAIVAGYGYATKPRVRP